MPAIVSPQTPAEMQLGLLFIEESVNVQADVCSRRLPTSKEAWLSGVSEWKTRHIAELSEMKTLALQFEQPSLRSSQASALIAAVQGGAVALPLYVLAGSPDAEANRFCDLLLSRLSDEKTTAEEFREARAAAAATLTRLEAEAK